MFAESQRGHLRFSGFDEFVVVEVPLPVVVAVAVACAVVFVMAEEEEEGGEGVGDGEKQGEGEGMPSKITAPWFMEIFLSPISAGLPNSS